MSQVVAQPDLGRHWVSVVVRLDGVNLVLVVLYLVAGIGFTGENVSRLLQVSGTVAGLKGPWLILADWNMTAEELSEVGFLGKLGAVPILPEDTVVTCSTGRGRVIDFGVAPCWFADLVKIKPDLDAPWAPHIGLEVEISLDS